MPHESSIIAAEPNSGGDPDGRYHQEAASSRQHKTVTQKNATSARNQKVIRVSNKE